MSYRTNRQKKQETFITLDPHTESFSIGTRCSTHQRNMFIRQRLVPSLQSIKNLDGKSCDSSLCSS